ncbi:hypothetical protein Ancab_027860 [Ancistrocladus abbreviatus]
MADLFSCKLLHSPSIDFTRFRALSLPLNLSPHLNFTILRFSSPRLKSFPAVLAEPSSHSTSSTDSRFDIISSTECSDGSVLFKFGYVDVVESTEHEDNMDRNHEVSIVSEMVERESRSRASVRNIKEHYDEVVDERHLQPLEVMRDGELELEEDVEASKQVLELAVLNQEKDVTLSDSAAGLILDDCFGEDVVKERNNETTCAERDMKNLSDFSVIVDGEQGDILDTTASVDDRFCGDAIEESNNICLGNSMDNLHDFLLVNDSRQSGVTAPIASMDDYFSGDVIKEENNEMTSLKSDVEDLREFHMVDTSKHCDALATTASVDDHFIGDVIKVEDNEVKSLDNDMEDARDFHKVDDGKQSDIVVTTSSEFASRMDDEKIIDSAEVIDEMIGGKIGTLQHLSELELMSEESDSSQPQAIDEISAKVEPLSVSLPTEDNRIDDSVNDLLSAAAVSEEEQIDSVEITVERTPSYVVVGADASPSLLQGQTDDDVENSDAMEGSNPKLDSLQIFSTDYTIPRVEISRPAYYLSSGAASLPHPSKNWFGVAGGVCQWSLEGNLDGCYAQELMQNCERTVSGEDIDKLSDVREVLKLSAAAVQSHGLATVLIAHFNHQVLHVANIGDTGFCLIRNGFVYHKSSPMAYEFNFPLQIGRGDDPLEVLEEYCVDVEDGDVIVTATDGLFDNLYVHEIASIVSKSVAASMKPKEIADLLATTAQKVGMSASGRTPFGDAVQAAGYAGYSGGKLDAMTVIVSLVLKQSMLSL